MAQSLESLLCEIAACRACPLPHEPRPVVRAHRDARILIVGQAPGRRVHETGLPWNDPSGDRLRDWLGLDRETFYDQRNIAVAAMGFCFPGTVKGADLPPRRECAPLWHPRLLPMLTNVRLTLLVGGYAQKWRLRERAMATLTDTVRNWRAYGPDIIPLPHPSWRNTGWLKRQQWFEAELVPVLQENVRAVLAR